MARIDRMGNRKARDQRRLQRVPEMGYYLVVTDTEATERCFFKGLHDSLTDETKQKLVIKVIGTKTQNLIQKCIELTAYDAQYRIPWIVFDRDQVTNFDEIIREATCAGIRVGWSNPCFEIWMHAYFGSMPSIQDSWTCCERFADLYEKRTGLEYSKADTDMYRHLTENGDEKKALIVSKRKYDQCVRNGFSLPSQMCPCTTVHELVGEIRTKTTDTKEP